MRPLLLAALVALPLFAQSPPCEDARTQGDLNRCRLADFRAADAELNATWSKLMAALDEEEAKAKLRGAQKKWIAFRDGACEAEAFTIAGGGSLEPALYHDCSARVTRERNAHLRLILDWRNQ